jgi:prepilin-type N-terminal cleavage/methylation domain-containing protein
VIARLADRLRRLHRSDEGFSLSELMISMSIMSVVTIISVNGFLDMFRTTDTTQDAALAQTSTMLSFSKLDREVRYAQRINAPYRRSNGDYAVEYVVPDGTGTPQCIRLTLPSAGGALMRLQWPEANATSSGTATTVALDMAPDNGSANPFVVTPGGGTSTSNFDRIEVKIKSSIGVTGAGAVRRFDLLYTALNTVATTTALLPCSQT